MTSNDTWVSSRPGDQEPILSFAVIADSHMNPEDDSCSSPWEVNRLANVRTRTVVEELNRVAPDFVVHLGDMIHPVPSQASYPDAAANFKELFSELAMPLHVVPGNHDVGDKPLEWTPAAVVTEEYVDLYEQHFGPSYYSFEHAGCQFVVVNAQLFNSDFPDEEAQRRWLERTLAGAERSFLFMHYPPFVLDPEEAGHYDNLDEPARSWLLDLIHRHQVEAVFSGHVHNFFYDHIAGTDYYILPSVSFVRSDYSEFARIAPEDDAHGRNDIGKLGYFLVELHVGDHRTRVQRTYGHVASAGEADGIRQLMPTPCRGVAATSVGVDLRHAWAETVEIPFTGGVDEFARKRARNDYPVMAMWELGITRFRVPSADLQDAENLHRMQVSARNGHRFSPFHLGLPDGSEQDLLQSAAELVESLEVILPGPLEEYADRLADLRRELSVPIVLSRLRGRSDDGSGTYHHVINHGYAVEDLARLRTDLAARPHPVADAVAVRVGHEQDPYLALESIAAGLSGADIRAMAQVRLAGEVPAIAVDDELAAAARVASALVGSLAFPEVAVFLDSFLDQDRGYFPRCGLLDRRFNLRLAGQVFRNLNVTLAPTGKIERVICADDLTAYVLDGGAVAQLLLVPGREQKVQAVPVGSLASRTTGKPCRVVDLATGSTSMMTWHLADTDAVLERVIPLVAPLLLEFPTTTATSPSL